MKTLITSLVLLVVSLSFVSLETSHWFDHGFHFSLRNNTNGTNCTGTGETFCIDCDQIALCLPNGTEVVAKCDSGYSCYNGSCVDYNPYCPSSNSTNNATFICRTSGIYPDPFDCKVYHYCVPEELKAPNGTLNGTLVLNRHTARCECDYAYNPSSNFCDIKLENGTCPYQELVACSRYGESQALWSNPSLYYICLEHPETSGLYPFLYACEHGKRYSSYERLCK